MERTAEKKMKEEAPTSIMGRRAEGQIWSFLMPSLFFAEASARPSEAVRSVWPWPNQSLPHFIQNKSYIV